MSVIVVAPQAACVKGKEKLDEVIDDHWQHKRKKRLNEVKAMGHDVSEHEL